MAQGVHLDMERVTAAFRRKGITHTDWAKAAEVSPNTITKVMQGKPVYRRTAARLVAALQGFPDVEGLSDFLESSP